MVSRNYLRPFLGWTPRQHSVARGLRIDRVQFRAMKRYSFIFFVFFFCTLSNLVSRVCFHFSWIMDNRHDRHLCSVNVRIIIKIISVQFNIIFSSRRISFNSYVKLPQTIERLFDSFQLNTTPRKSFRPARMHGRKETDHRDTKCESFLKISILRAHRYLSNFIDFSHFDDFSIFLSRSVDSTRSTKVGSCVHKAT